MRFELCLQMVMSRLRVAFVIVQILLRFRVLQLDSKDVVWFIFFSLVGFHFSGGNSQTGV